MSDLQGQWENLDVASCGYRLAHHSTDGIDGRDHGRNANGLEHAGKLRLGSGVWIVHVTGVSDD